ncbi:MAG: hypothetical protein A3F93_03095 [Candidatus Magasanikbacteria bacterium RIFCSPLOWO2_12_FULL_34_7]|nr:MAG: hypothetical protein A3F93_03095 [Candidatus Magasanikbacteria bacterium RIFCSPLOWO2_12_FULL_34_7]
MSMNKVFMGKIRKELHSYQLKRREIIRESGDALHYAKRAIFSMHRDDMNEAETKIKEAEAIFKKLNIKFKTDKKILYEGSYKAAVEEYVEASIFYQFITTGKISNIKSFAIDSDIYLAGLCDVPGELYRYAIKSATERNDEMVKKCSKMASDIIGELIEFDLTSYLRTKFDQAKQANQKLEHVVYEVSLIK